jgi:hypothetical protein
MQRIIAEILVIWVPGSPLHGARNYRHHGSAQDKPSCPGL